MTHLWLLCGHDPLHPGVTVPAPVHPVQEGEGCDQGVPPEALWHVRRVHDVSCMCHVWYMRLCVMCAAMYVSDEVCVRCVCVYMVWLCCVHIACEARVLACVWDVLLGGGGGEREQPNSSSRV